MRALVPALLLAGCAAPQVPANDWRFEELAACFPTRPRVRHTHEGPFAKVVIAASHSGGARYEVARFRLPRRLDRAQQKKLMQRVVWGLNMRPDKLRGETGTLELHGRIARAVTMDLDGGRKGRWMIFYTAPDVMLQVSVIGPAAIDPDALAFLDSFGEGCPSPSR
jgi:hypothetical protein